MLQTCSIGLQLCAALRVAHSNNIVHRDLKPENILLGRPLSETDPYAANLEVLVADFGIAKVSNISREDDGQHANLLQSGGFVGTPMYASPEQLMGKSATAASDIYSLVSVLPILCYRKALAAFWCLCSGNTPLRMFGKSMTGVSRHPCPNGLVPNMPQPTATQRVLFQTILSEAMRIDPRTRCSLQRLEQLLESLHQGAVGLNQKSVSMKRRLYQIDLRSALLSRLRTSNLMLSYLSLHQPMSLLTAIYLRMRPSRYLLQNKGSLLLLCLRSAKQCPKRRSR